MSITQSVAPNIKLQYGDFIKVKKDSDFRAGQDGMVITGSSDDGHVGMMFHFDRNNEFFDPLGKSPCCGIEEWHINELDISTLDRD